MYSIRTIWILLILCGSNLIIYAQDSKVNAGINAYESGDYQKAFSEFNTALAKPDELKNKNLPKAYYYRSLTWLKLMTEAAKTKNHDWLVKNYQAPLRAYEDCKLAEKHDDGKWSSKIQSQFSLIRTKLLQYSLSYLTTLQKMKDEGTKQATYDATMKFLEAALAIEKDYSIYDLMSQAESALSFANTPSKDYADQAIKAYQAEKPTTPDPFIGYAYYRKALAERYTDEDLKSAWQTVQTGIQSLQEEQNRLKTTSNMANINRLDNKFKLAIQDLQNFELDILLNSPDLFQTALEKFEKAVEESPNSYMKHVAYAALLERQNPTKAKEIYKKAIAIDPKQETAYFNLGVLYNNEAMGYYKKANEETDFDAIAQWNKKVDAAFVQAYAQFQKAHEFNPNALETVNALMQIAIRLEKLEDYKKYKGIKEALMGD